MKNFNDYLEKIQEEKYQYDERVNLDWKVLGGILNKRSTAGEEYDDLIDLFAGKTVYFKNIDTLTDFVNFFGASLPTKKMRPEDTILEKGKKAINKFIGKEDASSPKKQINSEEYERNVLSKTRLLREKSKQVVSNMIKDLMEVSKKWYAKDSLDSKDLKNTEESKNKILHILYDPKKDDFVQLILK